MVENGHMWQETPPPRFKSLSLKVLNAPEGDSGPVRSTLEALCTEHTNTHLVHTGITPDTRTHTHTRAHTPERLSDSVGAQVDDLDEVISGAGEQLGSVEVQVQRRYSTQKLEFLHDALRPESERRATAQVKGQIVVVQVSSGAFSHQAHLMSQNRTFLSKCPLMTHCSVHTMSLQLDPANTVFIPAQVKQSHSYWVCVWLLIQK